MNSLSKRIRKIKKTPKVTQYEDSNDPQQFTACIANLNQIVAEDQFKQIITKELLVRLIEYLRHNNPQVVINALNAIQNVLRISDNFGSEVRDQFKDLGLLGILLLFPIQENTLSSYLNLAIEIFETWNITLLMPFYQRILPILDNCLQKVYNEDIISETLNLLQVLTEIPQFNLKKINVDQIFQNDIIKQLHFANQMKLKALTLQIYLNIDRLDNEMFQLINEVIRINIFQELDNIESFLQKQVTMEEESEFKQDERLLSTLQIWKCSAQSIIQVLVYLNRIYEEDNDDQYVNNKRFQQFFQKNIIIELEELVLKNFFNYSGVIQKKLFTDQTTFTDEILSLTLLIFNLGNNLLANLQPLVCLQTIEPILPQIQAILQVDIISDEDKKELAQSELIFLIKLLKVNPQLVLQIPPQFIVNLCELTEKTDILFHIIEVMKIRYSSKVKNDIETIRQVTQKLLKLMNQSNIMLAAQALDCLFDVYTEEDFNSLLVEMNIIELLSQGYQYLQSQLPKEKKSLEKDDWKFLKLTVTNLKQFIEYKVKIIK
ncbi:unnamed protein product [Paramecium pentaurelia]|uniref:SYO1-like TPR repeats domain-containing protein n=1 Tax=Paramecium pentaurelia TaxID=43138 RepID=A0A8S1WDH0_9CILI|nr:unnamed protein product [Paramecium pentaurelia]